jgi:hypothetical protein
MSPFQIKTGANPPQTTPRKLLHGAKWTRFTR